ncbi:uncharacterized protein LOC124937487 [Impatiens glandulifera]|uniref:uncharacterized protein LOC124937487 n=1 Tax=Impatiens glandulifera TaxID=253017 RepID=UPI001FB1A129|nr:uncharacterized protein LOC124937487 [Impatiens glandulifera]
MNQSRQQTDIRGGRGSVVLELGNSSSTPTTIFEPQTGIDKRESSNINSLSLSDPNTDRAPEKKLTLFALRLAVLEKAATSLGTLGFIWATVVLLGGFAITLDETDFWVITVILVVEGARIFSRSHELEWQHQATWSITNDDGTNNFRSIFKTIQTEPKRTPTRKWETSDVPLLPYAPWVFLSRNVSKLLYFLQLASAMACVVLSLMKLIKHNYGEVAKGDVDKRNRKAALTIFYALALAEACLFLLEKMYWEYKVIICKLLDEVNNECQLGVLGMVSIKRFFYDAYSKCINGSIFDGLKMDMVSFAMELLESNSPDEQLIGARILREFATSDRFSEDTLQKIGINLSIIERLVEMLNWKDPEEEEIRLSAAEILSKVACKKQNSLRVAGISGAVESISSLLQTNRTLNSASDEIFERKLVVYNGNYSFWTFNHLGLLILKKLARDHDNCGKIGNTRGLLPKIIDFTHTGERLLKNEMVTESQIMTVKRSLQLLQMLASTTGVTGKQLRKEISEVVFTISNIRDILQYGEKHPTLQQLGIEILTSLALEEDATERIGGTGGVLKELFSIFFKEGMPETYNHVKIVAGQALAMLAMESRQNCRRIMKLDHAIGKLLAALEAPLLRVNSARILTNLCAYSGGDGFSQLRQLTSSLPIVLGYISIEGNKLQEVMVGLAARVFEYTAKDELRMMFEKAGMDEDELGKTVVKILKKHRYPPAKTPRIRRFVVELAISMMRTEKANVENFRRIGLEIELEHIMETTSEVESFNIFSGMVGMNRHNTSIHSLVEIALKLMQNK